MIKNNKKKTVLIIVLVVLTMVVGALLFISSDYWQSIRNSSASGTACEKFVTRCEKDGKGIIQCKKVCADQSVDTIDPNRLK